jgi:hypothetical protein
MRFVKSKPNEYLIVGRRGRVTSRGTAASAFLWPGSSYVLVSSSKQEAAFEMTQESKDGVPLRFKGIVIYRVVAPEAAASLFDFTAGTGHDEIKRLLGHVCLGELRAIVSHMTMQECIEQRKTTLTDAISQVLRRVSEGHGSGADAPRQAWGIELDVVQVAQVFIVDQELRRQLEAEVRDKIKATSELSEIRTRQEIQLAQTSSERRIQQDALETEQERIDLARKKLQLEKGLEQEEIEIDAPLRLLRIQKQRAVLAEELEMRRMENEVKRLEVEREMMLARPKHEMRKEILPLEQMPKIAQALAGMLQGANLSLYGEGAPLLSALGPAIDLVSRSFAPHLAPSSERKE